LADSGTTVAGKLSNIFFVCWEALVPLVVTFDGVSTPENFGGRFGKYSETRERESMCYHAGEEPSRII